MRIAMYGDSTVRQIFLRLVFFLRGYHSFAEHFFHADAIYKLNETHDDLYINGYDEAGTERWRQDIDAYPFSIEFIWARGNSIPFERNFIDNDPPTNLAVWHILGGLDNSVGNRGYSVDFVTKLDHMTKFPRFHNVTFMSQVSRADRVGVRGYRDHRPVPVVDGSETAKYHKWLHLQAEHQSMAFLPYFELEQQDVFHTNDNRTDMHYQCGILSALEQGNTGAVKTPSTGDCRDMFNLNLVMILSNILINNLKYHQT